MACPAGRDEAFEFLLEFLLDGYRKSRNNTARATYAIPDSFMGIVRSMARILALLSLVATCGISLTEVNRGPAGDRTDPNFIQNVRRPINPAGPGDCAFSRDTYFIVLADRVVDRDENDNEDDFREAGEPPRTFEQLRSLISRAVSHPVAFITPLAAPMWRTPLLC